MVSKEVIKVAIHLTMEVTTMQATTGETMITVRGITVNIKIGTHQVEIETGDTTEIEMIMSRLEILTEKDLNLLETMLKTSLKPTHQQRIRKETVQRTLEKARL